MHLAPNAPRSGRPPGVPDKRTAALTARITAFMLNQYGIEDYCPVLAMLAMIQDSNDQQLSREAKINGLHKIADYMYPRLKAVEVKVTESVDVKVEIVHKIIDRIRESAVRATIEGKVEKN